MFTEIITLAETFGEIQKIIINGICYKHGEEKFDEALNKIKAREYKDFRITRINSIVSIKVRIS